MDTKECIESAKRVFELQKTLAEESMDYCLREQRKTKKSLALLPIVSFWQNPWAWSKRMALNTKQAYLKKKIASQKAKIIGFLSAQSGLEHGDYTPAIRLLDKMLKGIPAQLNNEPITNLDDPSIPNARFYDLLRLRDKLAERQAE